MILRRVFTTGLVAAGLYVGVLAPTGALAQDPTPSVEPTPTATATPTPTATPDFPEVSASPTAAPTQSETQEAEETSTPEPTPTSTATPEPEETSTPDPTPTPRPHATPDPVPTVLPSPTPTATETGSSAAGSAGAGERKPSAGTTAGTPAASQGAALDVGDFTVDPATGTTVRKPRPKHPEQTAAGCTGQDSTSTSRRGCSEVDVKVADPATKIVAADGTPTDDNPTLSLASVGPAPIGVPNFFIEKFRIPPFLLPIYQAAGVQYGIRWEVLAAINEIETDYGRNLNVSTAGAEGWMQFMPATWKQYGTDANKDGVRDPYNPVDAIFATARYLKAAGAQQDLRRGIFAYNHADWYVDSVMLRARLIGGLPADFVGSLTGLTQARFPVHATSRYAGAISTKPKRALKGHNASVPVESQANRTGIDIFAKRGSDVIAVNDGRIVGFGTNARLGRYIRLQDAYGNTFTYGHLGSVARSYPAPRERKVTKGQIRRELKLAKDPTPTTAASRTAKVARKAAKPAVKPAPSTVVDRAAVRAAAKQAQAPATLGKDRLFANPSRPKAREAGGELQLAQDDYSPSSGAALRLNKRDYVAKPMRKGARVIAGTILGRIGKVDKQTAPHVHFEIRPAGRKAPRIDPKPILDGWKLLETTEMYRAANRNPFVGEDARELTIGQILLMSKEALQRHVLENPRIDVYECGRRDIRLGLVDRRVLATLEFLAASGLKPTVSSLSCGHGTYTTSGNVSEHSSGNAVDIAAVNGITITPATQGAGSITDMTIQRLLTLQGTMKPHQIISLMTFKDADNTLSMADHDDHIHVGFRPLYRTGSKNARELNAVLKPGQWIKLINRLNDIDNPAVPSSPSSSALKVTGGD